MRFIAWTLLLPLALLLMPLVAGCASGAVMARSAGTSELSGTDRDAQVIVQISARMDQCFGAMQRLQDPKRRQPEFLLPRDQDLLEGLLAEYLSCRNELELIAQRQAKSDVDLHRASLQCKTQHDVQLALFTVEDPVLWQALNQSFHRSGIPRGSCDRILHEVTASGVVPLTGETQERVNDVIRRRGLLLPAVENDLWHAPPMELLLASSRTVSTQLQRGQNLLVTTTGRIKNPMSRPLTISDEQRRQIRDTLQPGDILLTYTAGYVCNLVIPGNFKHAATFVGTEEERRRTGLSREMLLAIAGSDNQRLAHVLSRTTIESGERADVVEAVAEGVLLNSLDRMLDSRINRLIALRPRLNHAERAEQIRDVLSYVGDEFDFSFDLTDASDQVCTEVVYRSLQGRGGIELPLSQHSGRLTLPPDDILRYSAQTGGNQFECILVVDESLETAGRARILSAAGAQEWIAKLLAADL